MSYNLMSVSSRIGGRFFISRGTKSKTAYKYKATMDKGDHTEFIRNQSSLLVSETITSFNTLFLELLQETSV
jgi:hypothetical protein